MNNRNIKIESRNDKFTSKIKSDITYEQPCEDNEFLVKEVRTHGYNVLNLMDSCDYIDVFFLLYQKDLPTKKQKSILTKLSIFLINLGPRHTSARAAANAGIGRTDVNHIVPIAIMGMGGEYGGSKEVEQAMRYLKSHHSSDFKLLAKNTLSTNILNSDSDIILAPGFGTDFGGQSPFLLDVKDIFLKECPDDGYLNWANKFVEALANEKQCGWRLAGVVAAVLLDLDFEPRMGAGLFQILASPGAFAHGIQFSNKPITDMPFLKDEDYEIENN
jgi:citrate synthase